VTVKKWFSWRRKARGEKGGGGGKEEKTFCGMELITCIGWGEKKGEKRGRRGGSSDQQQHLGLLKKKNRNNAKR